MSAKYTFRKAVREQVQLLIGLIGPSGSGKTYSAMSLASGMVAPGERFAVIDTENRRALHYADRFDFDHVQMGEPFRPDAYCESILAAADAGYKVILVDSMSHEWAGVGGILEWQEEELFRMAGDNYQKREACKMAAWIKPKLAHKHMVQRLLQINAHVILCFRAEEKLKMEKDSQGKMQIVPIGWQPICEKNIPYELTVSMLLTPDNPGVPQFLKLQEQHKALFPAGRLIDATAGKAVSEWAKGGNTPPAATQTPQTRTQTSLQPHQVQIVEKLKEAGYSTPEQRRNWIADHFEGKTSAKELSYQDADNAERIINTEIAATMEEPPGKEEPSEEEPNVFDEVLNEA
jgi:hypothetical protein